LRAIGGLTSDGEGGPIGDFSDFGDMLPAMSLVIREMRDGDARSFLEVHHAAVRHLAVRDYPVEVIEAWAPLPITQAAVDLVVANAEDETRFIAQRDGHIIGLACLITANNELRACYVAPEAAGTGVGKALLKKIEETARSAGCKTLYASSSLTAEQFYRSQGYEVVEYGHHMLSGRVPMTCVKIKKVL
jgi:putative acetyltransferase